MIQRRRIASDLERMRRPSDSAPPGSREWLIGIELKYGGLVTQVPRGAVSPQDPRSEQEIREGGMTGGDRMFHHGYAAKYAEYLVPVKATRERVTLLEVGILQGSGLAMWCELFPDGRIIGMDIDLSHAKGNWSNLKEQGAFRDNEPELHVFDQFVDNTELVGSVLGEDRIDVCIDDGFHSRESILATMKSVVPYLEKSFVYFIEDNDQVHADVKSSYPDLEVDSAGELTVVSRGLSKA
jgi:hypothetical protein